MSDFGYIGWLLAIDVIFLIVLIIQDFQITKLEKKING